jgi:hypothetical protein
VQDVIEDQKEKRDQDREEQIQIRKIFPYAVYSPHSFHIIPPEENFLHPLPDRKNTALINHLIPISQRGRHPD